MTFDDGSPDIRHVPIEVLSRAYRSAFGTTLATRQFGYGDPRGSGRLRSAVASMLNMDRGLATTPDNICITRGSQMAIFIVAQSLVTPGDTVVVETLSYPPAREAFRRVGAQVATVGVDAHGIDIDDLETLCRRTRIRAVYVTPQHHFPTTVAMRPERRMGLMTLAARFGFAVVEDDYDHEFHFSGQPMLPLASFDADGQVIYIGSFSKLLSPSLRIGYIAGHQTLIDRAADEIMLVDRQGDPATECAVADMIEAGELHRHIRKMFRLYSDRRSFLSAALERELRDEVAYTVPNGGLAFWVKIFGANVDDFIPCCLEQGLHLQSPRFFSADGLDPGAFRLGFASLNSAEANAGVTRLKVALRILSPHV